MAPPRAKLTDIVEEMDLQNDMSHAYFDRQTGAVVVVTDDDIDAAEDKSRAEAAPDWEQESIELARQIAADGDDRFVALPDRFEIHEWQMMAGFAGSCEGEAAERLGRAIHRSGAFRRFKDEVRRLGLAERWYAYRDERYREIARDWCEENEIKLEPEEGGGT